ncbi:MAG: major facilitator superfamily 1 [Firmicutes bacterium]|nr:major facilitator superfamily 1 [Bacillota bacterium]
MNNVKLWTRDFLIDSITNLFIYLAFYLLMVTITTYAMDNLQASPSEAGLASGIFIVGTLIARVFVGKAIDRVGRKKTLYVGLVLFLGMTLLHFGVNNLVFLVVIRFLHGAAFGIAATATGTIAASVIPHERRGEGISYYAMSLALASAIGPFLGMFINQQGSFNMVLLLAAILVLASLIAVLFLRVPEAELTEEQLVKMKGVALSNFFEAQAIPISLVSIFIGLGYSSILSFMAVYAREINLADAGSFFFIVYAIATLISRPLTGRWFDQKGENFVMYPAFLVFALSLVILSQAYQGSILLLAGIFVGFGYGTLLSSSQAIAVKVSPRHRLGLATSTFYIFLDGGVGIGPFLLGFLIPITGFRGLYMSMAIVLLCCTFLYYFLHGRKPAEYGEELVTEG